MPLYIRLTLNRVPKFKVEMELILKTLQRTDSNKTKAAKLLDTNRGLLYSKIDQYSIEK